MGLAVRAFALIYSRTPPSRPRQPRHKSHTCTPSMARTITRHIPPAAARPTSSTSTSRSCRSSSSRRCLPPPTSQLWRPPHHPTRRTRAKALARLALSSRREARDPHPMARRRPPWRARACAPTLGSERERQPTSGDIEQLADRPEKVVVGGRWIDGDDACVAARFRPPWRPSCAAGERHRKDGRAVGARTARAEASLAQLLVFGASVLKIGGERQKNGAYCV